MLDQEGVNRFFQQCFELWINPELEKRKQSGLITEPFVLNSAEVVMFGDGSPLEVRLNEEVRSIFKVSIPQERIQSLGPGDLVSADNAQVLDIKPPQDEIDHAHVVLIRTGQTWAFTFNFTYNSGHVAECYKAAKEFFDSAQNNLQNDKYRSFIDNLYSAVELMSKCLLLMTPGEVKYNHNGIQRRINERKKNQVIGGDLAPLLNRLSTERTKARYETLPYSPDKNELALMLEEASSALELCKSQIPRRSKEVLGDLLV
jgi:uncharacterized protein (UPF0332 family)